MGVSIHQNFSRGIELVSTLNIIISNQENYVLPKLIIIPEDMLCKNKSTGFIFSIFKRKFYFGKIKYGSAYFFVSLILICNMIRLFNFKL